MPGALWGGLMGLTSRSASLCHSLTHAIAVVGVRG